MAYTDTNTTTGDIADQGSRIGVKGSEDLGGGMSAVYGMEWGVAVGAATSTNASANTNSALSARNQFVGLKGAFGTVLAGTHDTPYKLGGSADVFGDTVADAQKNTSGIIGRNGLDNRAGNAIAYISPDWNGFHFAAAAVTNDGAANATAATSVVAVYANGALKATLGQESFKNAQKGTKFNIGYKIGDIGLGYTHEQSQRAIAAVTAVAAAVGVADVGLVQGTNAVAAVAGVTAATHATKDSADLISVTYGMGPITLAAQYGKFDDKVGPADVKRTTAGAIYSLSKKTNVALAYTRDDNQTAADTNGYTLQLNHSF